MQYCKKCVMPDTRPGSHFDEDGICLACVNYEKRKRVDWNKRWQELEKLCSKYRSKSNYYNCAIAVSGGKDSHYLTYLAKEKLNMNPLLIRVGDGFSNTFAGTRNIRNLLEVFNCDMIEFNISIPLYRKLTRYCFEKYANFPFVDGTIYSIPIAIVMHYNIPLLIYGENPYYEFGTSDNDLPDAMPHIIYNQVTMDNLVLEAGASDYEVNSLRFPMNGNFPQSVFMSYYVPWSGWDNWQIAKQYGFKDLAHEWKREGNIEDYDQIDIVGWMVSSWLKYIKFGFARATDIASRWVREKRITRQEAVKLVNEHDPILDQKVLDDFLSFTGYSVREFWEIVERFWNRDIFEKVNGIWKKKEGCVLR